jgi:hypothetical protein
MPGVLQSASVGFGKNGTARCEIWGGTGDIAWNERRRSCWDSGKIQCRTGLREHFRRMPTFFLPADLLRPWPVSAFRSQGSVFNEGAFSALHYDHCTGTAVCVSQGNVDGGYIH